MQFSPHEPCNAPERFIALIPKVCTTALGATLASARAVARLEANAAAIHAEATERRGFQAVSSKDGFSALIRHKMTVMEISGDDFAVRQTD
jgi:hypothetical protein